jgi:hypothetical protein
MQWISSYRNMSGVPRALGLMLRILAEISIRQSAVSTRSYNNGSYAVVISKSSATGVP